jgi:hypothetical protein
MPKKEYKSGRGETRDIRSEPCLCCLNSVIARKLSLKGCFDNVLNRIITRRCWLYTLGYSCTLIPCFIFIVGLAFIKLFINRLDKHKVS